MMRFVLLLVLFSNQVLAQPLTGVWTGKFSREGKSVLMQVDILEDRRETYGIVLLISNDSAALVSKYVVKLTDSGNNKYLFRRMYTDFEKAPVESYQRQVVMRGRWAPTPNDPNLTRAVVQPEVLVTSAEKSLHFQQFIGKLTDSSTQVFSGTWYVSEVGINSYERPTGQFILQKLAEPLSKEREQQLRSFIKQ